MSSGTQPPTLRGTPVWRRLLPFALAAALLAFVLGRLDFVAFVGALRSGKYLGFLAFTLAFDLGLLAADSLATAWVYRRFVAPVRVRDLFVVRGASYVPALVNHHLGQAWFTWMMARLLGVPLWRVAGATLFVYATTFAGVVLLGVAAWPLAGAEMKWLGPVVTALLVAGAGYLGLIALRPRWMAARAATAPLVEAGVRGHLIATALRFPHVLVQLLGAWLPFWFFGVEIPLGDALVYGPVLMLVVTLPLTPVGVGTRDVLALELFAKYAPGDPAAQQAAVAACTLSWAVGLTLIQGVTGPLFLRLSARLLRARERERGGAEVLPAA